MKRDPEDYIRRNPRAFDPARLHLKIRVILLEPMTQADAERALRQTIDEGELAPGIEIRWVDWRKGDEGRIRSGRLDDERIMGALMDFWGAINSAPSTRFAPVKGE